MYSVYQHWDPLKVCLVGRSYGPDFYKFIKNSNVRSVFEKIATETEEDYQKLIKVLEQFGVKVMRPNVTDNYLDYLDENGKIFSPPMCPRDYTIMLGQEFFFKTAPKVSNRSFINELKLSWNDIKGTSWPELPPNSMEELKNLPQSIQDEIVRFTSFADVTESEFGFSQLSDFEHFVWGDIINDIEAQGNKVYNSGPRCVKGINSASHTRVGKDIYVGTECYGEDKTADIQELQQLYPNYRWHVVDTRGHSDATFCPVKPGLIVSLYDIPSYQDTFPGWEIVYLPGQSWHAVAPFLKLKTKNAGKWWVPGEELNDEFTSFVEQWLNHWVGFVEETVFDVNMLVIDEKNVVCNNYNKEVFDAFERHGITPHVVNFRHRYFWDGGLHCITSDVSRIGTMHDYFLNRG